MGQRVCLVRQEHFKMIRRVRLAPRVSLRMPKVPSVVVAKLERMVSGVNSATRASTVPSATRRIVRVLTTWSPLPVPTAPLGSAKVTQDKLRVPSAAEVNSTMLLVLPHVNFALQILFTVIKGEIPRA